MTASEIFVNEMLNALREYERAFRSEGIKRGLEQKKQNLKLKRKSITI